MKNDRFLLSALVDFPDDCNLVVFTPDLVENLIDRLHWMGVRRVYWNYYQKGMWENFADNSEATRQTLSNLGEPLALGCRLGMNEGWSSTLPSSRTRRCESCQSQKQS